MGKHLPLSTSHHPETLTQQGLVSEKHRQFTPFYPFLPLNWRYFLRMQRQNQGKRGCFLIRKRRTRHLIYSPARGKTRAAPVCNHTHSDFAQLPPLLSQDVVNPRPVRLLAAPTAFVSLTPTKERLCASVLLKALLCKGCSRTPKPTLEAITPFLQCAVGFNYVD
jgi:hypothetical protein